jgi:hypothetical protein
VKNAREKRAPGPATTTTTTIMTTSTSSSSSAAEKEKEGGSREKSRAKFVSSLIKAMEEAMEMSAADADSNDDADSSSSLAEKCVEKMRFDYPDATRKELERLSESIDGRVLMMTSSSSSSTRDGGGGDGGEWASLEFDSKVIENIALGATKADAAAERMQSATTTTTRTRTTTTERSENDNHATIRDAYRKLAIQVYAEFPLRMMMEDEKVARNVEAILGEVDFSEEEEERRAETDEPGLEDIMAFAEESGVEKTAAATATESAEKNIASASDGAVGDDESTDDDDDDVANWIPLETNGFRNNVEVEKSIRSTRNFTRIEKMQYLLRKLTPALIGADDYSRVSDGSAPYVSRKTTETLVKLFEIISEKIQSSKNSSGQENIVSYRAMRSAVMNCLRSRFLVSPNDIVANECLKRVMKSLRFGEYAKRTALEKKMNGDDGAKEDDLDAMALLAHLAVRFAEKNALGANFSVFGQLENSASSSNLSNARRAFAPLVADSLFVVAARFWGFVEADKNRKGDESMSSIDEEDAALNACALLLSYTFTSSGANSADSMILSSGCIASLAAYFSAKGVLKEGDDNMSSYFTPGSAAARRCISLGIASSKATREYFSKAPLCVAASKVDSFVNSSHGVVWSLAVDADEEEAVRRMKHISATHANSIEMLNTILLISACFASVNTKGANNALWQREGAFHQTLAEILVSTKEVEKRLVEDAKRRIAERRGQKDKKRNDSDDDDDDDDESKEKMNDSSLSDVKLDPELEKARDIATMSSRVLKDLVAASTFGDVAAIRKSD